MNTEKKDTAGNELFSTSRIGPEPLTHKAVEDYLAKGRRMQSEYVWGVLHKSGRWLRANVIPSVGWFGALPEQKRRRCGGIEINRESPC